VPGVGGLRLAGLVLVMVSAVVAHDGGVRLICAAPISCSMSSRCPHTIYTWRSSSTPSPGAI